MLHWGRWRRVSITAPTPKRGRMVPAHASWVISPVSQPAPARTGGLGTRRPPGAIPDLFLTPPPATGDPRTPLPHRPGDRHPKPLTQALLDDHISPPL